MRGRVAAVFAACALSVGMIVALVPHEGELLQARLRDAGPAEAVRLLEVSRRVHPTDVALASRLAFAYERVRQAAPGLEALADVGRERALTPTERALAVRLGYALGQPLEAVRVLSGPHEAPSPTQRAELVALALAGGAPKVALSHQRALALAEPAEANLGRWRDMAIAAGALPEALSVQRRLAIHDEPAALERLAALSLQANDPEGALEAAERRLKGHDDPAWRKKAADFAMWAKLPARAVPHLEAVYRRHPAPEAGLSLAKLLQATASGRALPFARELSARFPGHAGAFEHLLGLVTRAHRLDEAKALLAARAARWPDDATVHGRRVDYLLGQGDRRGALGELSRWLGRHRSDRRARHQLAVVQVWDGKPDAGWRTYESLLADTHGPMDALETTWREEWAKVSGVLDDFTPQGHDNLVALAAAKPNDAAVWRRLAASENEAGDRTAAIRAQRHVVALPGASGQDALRLAEWLMWNDQVAEGLGLLKTLDARAPLPKEVLEDAVERAGKAWRFTDAADFLEKLAERAPADTETVEALARTREAAGDLAGAEAAYRRRLSQPGADATVRQLAAGIALKRHRLEAALAYVSVPGASVSELQLQAYLAGRLNRPEVQARALRAIVAKTPSDWEARLALADLADRQGHATEAAAQESAAIALRPHDARLIARLAGRRLAGSDTEAAAPYIALLEKTADPGTEGQRVLADYYQGRDAAKAAVALDRLHAAGGGDAETYFRRGELAAQAQAGSVAEASFAEAVRRGRKASEVGEREAAAYALERLGRDAEADRLWNQLKVAYPNRPSPQLALARRALDRGDMAGAAGLLGLAEAIAPDATEVKLLRAEWLRASGRTAEAADAFAALRRAEPQLRYLAAAEAMARHDLGDWGRARSLVRDAVARAPHDKDLLDAHRQVRTLGASRVEGQAFFEAAGNMDRQRLGLSSVQRVGDRLRLLTDVGTLSWSGGAMQSRELKLGARWSTTALEVTGQLGVQTGLAAPVGGVGVAVGGQGPVRAEARLESVRWEDSNATVLANGREHRLTAEAAWQPDPRVGVRLGGGVGQLNADGRDATLSASGLAEAVVRPWADSPWMAAYQLQHRHWGAIGPALGLANDMTLHSVLLGYDGRLGPLRLELRPGLMQDLRGGGVAPLAGGNMAWELGPDHEILLQGLWAGRSFNTGVDGTYHQVSVSGQWFF